VTAVTDAGGTPPRGSHPGRDAPAEARADAVALTTPLREIPGVPAAEAEAMEALGVRNVGQLLVHLPHRHERELGETSIADLAEDAIVSAAGEVTATRVAGRGRRARFEAVLHDGTGRLDLVWFNMPYLHRRIGAGSRIRVKGKSQRRGHALQIVNPRWSLTPQPEGDTADAAEGAALSPETDRLRAVYPASERIDSRAIGHVLQ